MEMKGEMDKKDSFVVTKSNMPIFDLTGCLMCGSGENIYKEYSLYGEEPGASRKQEFQFRGIWALVPIVLRPPNEVSKELLDKSIIPKSAVATALLDTGAYRSAVPANKVEFLGLPTYINGTRVPFGDDKPIPTTCTDLSIHILDVFPGKQFLNIAPMVESKWAENHIDFLIGWDVLKYCKFEYNGALSRFSLEFIERK